MELPVNYISRNNFLIYFSQSKYLTNPIFCCSMLENEKNIKKVKELIGNTIRLVRDLA